MKARRMIKALIITLALSFIMGQVNVEAVMLKATTGEKDENIKKTENPDDYSARFGWLSEKSKAERPGYAPGEVIVKFKAKGILAQNVAAAVHGRDRFMLTARDIKNTPGIPQILKDLTDNDKVTLEPVFKNLHAKMNKGISEEEVNRDTFEKLSQKRKMPIEEPKDYNLANIYILKNVKPIGKAMEGVCDALSKDPNIEYAEPNYIVKAQMTPNDKYYGSSNSWGQDYGDLWGLEIIQCQNAWDISQGEGVIVAVIDTGVDYNHPDIWDNIWVDPEVMQSKDNTLNPTLDDCDLNGNHQIEPNEIVDNMFGWDFIGSDAYNPIEDNNPMDGYGHGTHVSGTIAATGNNEIGIIGVAPKSKIMILKALDDQGYGLTSGLADAIIYATDKEADVLNNSWAGSWYDESGGMARIIEDAIKYAYSNGCVIVAAAGNHPADIVKVGFYPAKCPEVIAVGASTSGGSACEFSNYGKKLDVVAPGGGVYNEHGGGADDRYNILSTMPDNSYLAISKPQLRVAPGYYRLAGTSMAAPHVSGLAALILARNKRDSIMWSCDQIKMAICASCDRGRTPPDIHDTYLGYGRINALNALLYSDPEPFPYISLTAPDDWQVIKEETIDFTGTATAVNLERAVYHSSASAISAWPAGGFPQMITHDPVTDGPLWPVPTDWAFLPGLGCGMPWNLASNDGQYSIDAFIKDSVNGYHNIVRRNIFLGKSQHEGFPCAISSLPRSYYQEKVGPVIADINGDGGDEIIAGEGYGFTVIGGNGQVLWRKWSGDDGISEFSLPSVDDLNSSENKEIVLLGASDEGAGLAFYLLIYKDNGNCALKKRLPYDRDFIFFCAPPVLADVNQDGYCEIIVQARVDGEGYIFILNGDGDEIRRIKVPYTSGGYNSLSIRNLTPAVGDINNDSKPEIIVATDQQSASIRAMGIIAIDSSGNTLWKREICGISLTYAKILIGNVTGDRAPEVIIRANNFRQNSLLYVLNGSTGDILVSWSLSMAGWCEDVSDIILADLDGDRLLEILTSFSTLSSATDGCITAYKGDGSIVSGWENRTFLHPAYVVPTTSCLMAADLDGDGENEVVAAGDGALGVFKHDGTHLFTNLTGWGSVTFPAAGDIDGDGKLELVCLGYRDWYLSFQGCHAWDMDGDVKSIKWPMYLNNPQHTSCCIIPNSPPRVGTVSPSSGSSSAGEAVKFTATYTDPDGWQDIKRALIQINITTDGARCFYGYYDQNSNKFYLRNDDNTAWLGGYEPGSHAVIENSYVKLACRNPYYKDREVISGSGDTLTVKWNVTFKASFANPVAKNTYLYVRDDSNQNHGWIKKGTWTVRRR